MRFSSSLVVAALFSPLLAGSISHAALIGTSVAGSLAFFIFPNTNYFDPANGGGAGTGALNTSSTTVTVAEPVTEFGFQNSVARVTANLTDSQVLIQEQNLTFGTGLDGFTIKLTDAAFSGTGVTLAADTFPGTTASVVGNTLTITAPARTQSLNTLSLALYTVAVPEPTAMAAMSGVALLSLRRRRQQR